MGRPPKRPPRGWLLLAGFVRAAAAAFTCLPANNPADCGALGDLYAAAGGAAWAGVLPTDGWSLAAGGGAPDVCTGSFTGVTCDASGRVASMCVPRAAPVPSAARRTAAKPRAADKPPRARHALLGGPDSISPRSSLIQKGLVGSLPASLGNLTGLARLCVPRPKTPRNAAAATDPSADTVPCRSLSNNAALTGSIPGSLCALTNLNWLCVPPAWCRCRIRGLAHCAGPLGLLRPLTWFCVRDIALTLREPEATRGIAPSATQRTHFHRRTRRSLFNSNISGTIPNCIGSLVHLQNLFLGNMQLTGVCAACREPAAAALTPNAGTVPHSLGSLTAMQQIGLHLNSLSGTLPSSLGNMLNATLLCAWGLAVHVNACC